MIYLQTEGGLANRLRAIASAYKLAKEHNQEITVKWDINADLHCKFQNLFCLIESNIYIYCCQYNKIQRIFNRIIHKIFPSRYISINNEENRKKFIANFLTEPNKDYYIKSYSNFYDAHDYDFITPTKEITNQVNEILSDIDIHHLVGVQIRRTDNAQSIANSPLEAFIETMRAEEAADHNVTFYLATDHIPTREQLQTLFPNKIICNANAEIARNTENGMKDAMIDFISLSRCRKILGSYWSSFCEVASDIGKNELVVVKK